MPRFFIGSENICGEEAFVTGADAVHIGRSLRMRLGDEITLCYEGREYSCKLLSISDTVCRCEILSCAEGESEPDIALTLFQAVPKSDKLELIVQKAVELGACGICPVLTGRCVSRPDEKSFRKKLDRLNKIALEAAKQCGRSIVPTVSEIISFDECVKRLCEKDIPIICYEKGGKNLREINWGDRKANVSVGVLVGSEGGFEPSEAEKCISAGIIPVGLGSRILRCETAPIAALSIIMNLTGNM